MSIPLNEKIDSGTSFLNFDEKIYNKLLDMQLGDDNDADEAESFIKYFTINPLGSSFDYDSNNISVLLQGASSKHLETLDETSVQSESVEILIGCKDYNDGYGQYQLLRSVTRDIHRYLTNQSNPVNFIPGVSHIQVDTMIPSYDKDNLSNRSMSIDVSGVTSVSYRQYSKTYKDILLMIKMGLNKEVLND
jgi:hypothetical protein